MHVTSEIAPESVAGNGTLGSRRAFLIPENRSSLISRTVLIHITYCAPFVFFSPLRPVYYPQPRTFIKSLRFFSALYIRFATFLCSHRTRIRFVFDVTNVVALLLLRLRRKFIKKNGASEWK